MNITVQQCNQKYNYLYIKAGNNQDTISEERNVYVETCTNYSKLTCKMHSFMYVHCKQPYFGFLMLSSLGLLEATGHPVKQPIVHGKPSGRW